MSKIEFSEEETEVITGEIKKYFTEELDQEISPFQAGFLLDFFAEKIGPYYYNRGLYDARAVLMKRLENITEAIYEIEKPTEFAR